MPDYGLAIKRAYDVAGDDRQIYSTYEGLSSPFMLALYYNDYDPVKFSQTVVYKDPDAEFRIAYSFGNFIFDDLPEDVSTDEYKDTVFVTSYAETEDFNDDETFTIENYGIYSVVYR
jgi:hypothetical protein